MKILILNCGSSSVKYALFNMPKRVKLCHGIVDMVAAASSTVEHVRKDRSKCIRDCKCPDHDSAIRLIIDLLTERETGVIKNLSEIRAVGHRVVHGGERFVKPVVIDNEVLKGIEEYASLAPLHNPANLMGIKAISKLEPNIVQVAVFDTSFFTTMPPHVFIYGLPYEWYEKYHIRRYGFHGSSHRFVAKRAAVLLSKKSEELNIIILHIGNGVSITAVKSGAAYDHSMGFTPLEGAVMGTRCGDIDPGIPLFMMQKEKLGSRDMEDILNKKSGLLGVTGKYTDRRDILRAMQAGDERARLSFELECYRLRKYIGAYTAAMGGVDAIVFTGGVGENSILHRLKICEGLGFLGIKLDDKKNKKAVGGEKEMEISHSASRVKVFVIPTDEELVIAEDTLALLDNNGNN